MFNRCTICSSWEQKKSRYTILVTLIYCRDFIAIFLIGPKDLETLYWSSMHAYRYFGNGYFTTRHLGYLRLTANYLHYTTTIRTRNVCTFLVFKTIFIQSYKISH